MKNPPLVSVYTCVYNGAHTIERVFKSLKAMDYPNIEHVIINDGSTDDTEKLIKDYIASATFPVKYIKKENGGKHTALNAAWSLATGDFLLELDADDELLPHSVSFLVNSYYSIPEDIRKEYWCVHGRVVNQYGEFVGDKYPDTINQQHWTSALKDAGKCKGDKRGLQVKSYLAQYQFPEIAGVSHLPEGIVWDQINRKYGTWYTNEVIGIYYVNEGSNLTSRKKYRRQFAPYCYKYKWQLSHPDLYSRSVYDLIRYSLFYCISNKEFRANNKYLEGLKSLRLPLILLYPIAALGALSLRLIKRIK